MNYATEVIELSGQDITPDNLSSIIEYSAWLLACIVHRIDKINDPYELLTFPPGYFDYFPLNLHSLKNVSNKTWANLSIYEWMKWILKKWVIDAHINVALRKLRYQSESTFKVRPDEDGYVVVDTTLPDFTNPRFNQGRQVLIDIGALELTNSGKFKVTEYGKILMV